MQTPASSPYRDFLSALWDNSLSPILAVETQPASLGRDILEVRYPPPLPQQPAVIAKPSFTRLSKPEQLRLKAKAETLRAFFGLFFRSDEQVRIFPIMRDEVADRRENDPKFPDIICGRWVKRGDRPITKFREGISVTVGSSRLASAILKLEEFNHWGYDIYWCINPLSASRRLKCTVREIRTILIESDHDSLDQQIATEFALRRHIRASVYTGNKSRHMLIRIEPPIRNYDCIYSWRRVKQLKSGEGPTIEIPEYNVVVERWRLFLADKGFSVDMNVLSDFSRLSRVPGFINHKTTKTVEICRQDSDAWWIINGSVLWKPASNISIQENPDVEASLSGAEVPLLEPGLMQAGKAGDVEAHGSDCVSPTVTINVTITPQSGRGGRTFLDNLAAYQQLRTQGIPRRHARNRLHIDMLRVARLLDWDDIRLGDEWKSIVSIQPENIGCSMDEAVKDLLKHRQRSTAKEVWLPDTTQLPKQIDDRVNELKSRLKELRCPDSSSCARIIAEVLYPLVRTLPRQCTKGTVSIRSREMQRRCVSKRSRLAMTWLHTWNVLRVVDPEYIRGQRTKRYFVNTALVIWLLCFTSQDLVWTAANHRE